MEEVKVFDPSKLTEQQLGCLEFLVNSPAFIDVIEPYIKSQRDSLYLRLLDPSKERKEEMPDDFLRGGIVVMEGLTRFFRKITEETRFERVDAAHRSLSPDQQYTRAQEEGQHVPVLGANEPLDVEPDRYDPAEDF